MNIKTIQLVFTAVENEHKTTQLVFTAVEY